MGIFRFPGHLYDHLYGSYGWLGVTVASLSLVMLTVSLLTWFDRRR